VKGFMANSRNLAEVNTQESGLKMDFYKKCIILKCPQTGLYLIIVAFIIIQYSSKGVNFDAGFIFLEKLFERQSANQGL
jgi:hypothetical protein